MDLISSISGYPDAAAANILHAAQAAVDRGSLGSIVATWTESIALGSLLFALPGWILQAGLSWNHSIHWVTARGIICRDITFLFCSLFSISLFQSLIVSKSGLYPELAGGFSFSVGVE